MDLPILDKHFKRLLDIYNGSHGHMSAGLGLPVDADDTACSLFVLFKKYGIKNFHALMKFFNHDYFQTFKHENLVSISTNINCLITLIAYDEENDSLNRIMKLTADWIKNKIIESKFIIFDKWHISIYYPLSRALIAFTKIDPFFSLLIIEFLISKQNKDGGWGMENSSTYSETSLIVISLFYWLKNRATECGNINNILKNCRLFFDTTQKAEFMWIDKCLYSPLNIDSLCVNIAKYLINLM